jgi:hypothetical protein
MGWVHFSTGRFAGDIRVVATPTFITFVIVRGLRNAYGNIGILAKTIHIRVFHAVLGGGKGR